MLNKKTIIVLLAVCPAIFAVCCQKSKVNFKLKQPAAHNCREVENAVLKHDGVSCELHVCGNGKPSAETHCGFGLCNRYNCNCDGGCIPGVATEELQKNHADLITDVQDDPWDLKYAVSLMRAELEIEEEAKKEPAKN